MASRIDYLQNRKLYVGTAPEVTVADGNAIITGNVGIGTTNPGAKLDVTGTGNFTGEVLFDAGFKSDSILLSGSQNFDNIARSGFYNLYNTNSGSTGSPGFDYGTMVVVGGNKQSQSFGFQMANERLGNGLYVRGMNDTLSAWSSWAEVWTSTTDGAGSGLDADLLDGQQGSYYVNTATTQSIAGVKSFSGKIGADGGIDGLTLANGGINGSNYDIRGVNQLVISDPGEGIVFTGTATMYLNAVDDATDSILKLTNATQFNLNSTARITNLVNPSGAQDAATKNYVDTEVGNIPSGLSFEGNWNASTDSPSLAGTTPGNGIFYIVSVAGSTSLSGITDWAVGDWAVFVSNGAGTDAWQKVDNSSSLAGAGQAGKVTFWSSTSNVSFNTNFSYDGTNLTVPRLRVGDGTDGYFYSDTAGRTAFRSGDFYIQNTVANYYNYANAIYLGDTTGDNVFFRGSTITGTNWGITPAGAASFTTGTFTGDLILDDGSGASPSLILKNASNETWEIRNSTQGKLNFFEGSDVRFALEQGGDATFAGNVDVDGSTLNVGSSNQVSIVSSGPSLFPSLKVNNNGYLGSASVPTQMQLLSSGSTIFSGLVSGITPVNAANFVTKAYVDGSGGGTGPFLPLAGGTMTGDLVVDGANITIDTDTAGNSLVWKESDSSTLAGQLRGYGNRGDIYLYFDGVKKTELSSSNDSFIPALHIGGTAAASGGVLQVTGNATFSGLTTLETFPQTQPIRGEVYSIDPHNYISGVSYWTWTKIAQLDDTGHASLRYNCKADVNYPHVAVGWVTISSYNSSSISISHQQLIPSETIQPQIWLDNNRDVWIRMVNASWVTNFQYNWEVVDPNVATIYDGTTQSNTQPANSTVIEVGQEIKFPYTNAAAPVATATYIPQTTTGNILARNGNITLGGTGRIQGVDTVSATTDAANKAYVDAHGGGVGPFLTIANPAFTGTLTGPTITITGDVTADQFISTNNGNGQNYRIGDDAWIGDINIANTFRVQGSQNPNNGYITFGNSSNAQLGRAGTGALTWGGDFETTGDVTVGGGDLYTTRVENNNTNGNLSLRAPNGTGEVYLNNGGAKLWTTTGTGPNSQGGIEVYNNILTTYVEATDIYVYRLYSRVNNVDITSTSITLSGNTTTPSGESILFKVNGQAASNTKLSITPSAIFVKTELDMDDIIDMNNNKITELATPTAGTDAANKDYVDNAIPVVPGESYINAATFSTSNGIITGTGVGSAGFTVDIDGRYPLGNVLNTEFYIALQQNPVGTTYGDGVSTLPTYYFGQKAGGSDAMRFYAESAASNDITAVWEINDDIETGLTWLFRNKKTYSPYTATDALKIDGDGDVTVGKDLTVTGGDIVLSGTGRIQGINTITDSTDAVNKAYVDARDGTVKISGTPAIKQIAEWTSADTIKGSATLQVNSSGTGVNIFGNDTSGATGIFNLCKNDSVSDPRFQFIIGSALENYIYSGNSSNSHALKFGLLDANDNAIQNILTLKRGSGVQLPVLNEIGSDTDKFLMVSGTDNLIEYVTGANLLSYIGGTGSSGVTSIVTTAPILGGTITGTGTLSLKTPVSGNWFNGGALVVGSDGLTEIGRYIDFHNSNTTTADYDVRLDCYSANNLRLVGSLNVTQDIVANSQLGVGITPAAGISLEVNGKIRADDNNSGDHIQMYCDGSVTGDSFIENTNSSIIIKSANATTRIDASGAAANLEVLNASNVATIRLRGAADSFIAGGDLGIGNTGPVSGIKLDVTGKVLIKTSDGLSDLYMGNYSVNKYIRFHTNNSDTYFDMNCGRIYWRVGSSTKYDFDIANGNMQIDGTLTQSSDIRLKENITEISDCISKVQAMRGVYYNKTESNTEDIKIGVIAQEVEAVLPELVIESPETGLKSVAYSELTSVLINAIKEQQEIIEDLKLRITKLEN